MGCFLSSIPTKSKRDKYNRARLLRQKICDQVLHRVFGKHSLDNAYTDVDLGSHHHGIKNGATVSDILHTLQTGTIPRLVKTIIGVMTDSQKTLVNRLVEELVSGGNNRSSERMLFPRVLFTRVFSFLTLLNAEGKTGQLFVITALLQLERGKEVLASKFAKDFDSRRDNHAKRGKKKAERQQHVDEVEQDADEANDTVQYDMCCVGSEGSSSCSEVGACDDECTATNSDTDTSVTGILEI
jgi:hypothetical protein